MKNRHPRILLSLTVALSILHLAAAGASAHLSESEEMAAKRDPAYFAVPKTRGNATLPVGKWSALLNAEKAEGLSALVAPYKISSPTAVNANALHLWRGLGHYAQKRYEEATAEFDQCTNLDDASLSGRTTVAMSYFFLEQYDKAIPIFNYVLSKHADCDVYSKRATCYVAMQKNDLALRDYLKAAEYSSYYHGLYLARAGNIYRIEKKYPQAIATFTESLKNCQPKFQSIAYSGRAYCYQQTKRFQEAIKDYTSAIKILNENPKSRMNITFLADAFRERANCYDAVGKKALAASDRQTHGQVGSDIASDLFEPSAKD